jgi:hypothetical protein
MFNPLRILNPAHSEAKGVTYFPELEFIKIDLLNRGFRVEDESIGAIPFLLMDIVIEQKAGLSRLFTIDVYNAISPRFWALQVEHKLAEVVRRGHKLLYILYNNQPPAWLVEAWFSAISGGG